MSLPLTLLLALGITVGVCILAYAVLVACFFVPVLLRPRRYGLRTIKADDADISHLRVALPAFFAFVYGIVLGILYLPPGGRVNAALAVAPLVFYVLLRVCSAPANPRP